MWGAVRHGMWGRMGGGMMGRMWMHRWMHLDLSDDQKGRLLQILFDTKKQMIQKWAEVKVAHLELKQMMLKKDADRGKAEQAVRDIGQKKTDLGLLKVNALMDALAVLTEGQRKALFHMPEQGDCPVCGEKGGWAMADDMADLDVEAEGEEEEEE